MKVFLVLHRGALGDYVLTWPALAALRRAYPLRHFLAIGRPDYLELARALGLIDSGVDCEAAELLSFYAGEALPDFIKTVDVALLWTRQDSRIDGLLRRSCSGPVVFHPPFPEDGIHVLDHHLRSLSRFSISTIPTGEPGFLFGGSLNSERREREDYALIHPGSGSPAKNFSPEFYARLAGELRGKGYRDTRIVLGPAEKNLRQYYQGRFAVEEPPSTLGLAQLLSGSALFVGNDSGASHLAALLGVPTLALYKSTSPAQWGVRGPKSRALSVKDEGEAGNRIHEVLREQNFARSSIGSKLLSQAPLTSLASLTSGISSMFGNGSMKNLP